MNKNIDFQPKKVFLTGANGFLGKAILCRLQKEGISVVCYTRREFLKGDEGPNIVSVVGELDDSETIRQALEGCDSIIHCAGLISFDPKDFGRQHFIHCEALKNLISISRTSEVKRLIYVSSHWTVGFSLSRFTCCSEQDVLSPDNKIYNVYQKTKLEGENLLRQEGNSETDYIIVNPTQIWGIENKNVLLCQFIKKAKTKKFFVVPACGINIVHVEDVANGILLALRHGASQERYILGGENLTLKSLIHTFFRLRGLNGVVFELPFVPMKFLTRLAYRIIGMMSPTLLKKYHFLNSIVSYKYYTSNKAEIELGFKHKKKANEIVTKILSKKEV